jgi:hypothetical protein
MNVEQRLSDTLRVYRVSTPGSIDLWDRIEGRTAKRRPALRLIAVGVVVVVLAVIGAVTLQLRRDDEAHQVTAAALTQEQFVEAANRTCAELRPKLDEARVVFPTATGYEVVAGQLAQLARSALAQAEALPVPDSARRSVAANLSDLRGAIAGAERARSAAQHGDLPAAETEITQVTAAINRVGVRLANDGAEGCRP